MSANRRYLVTWATEVTAGGFKSAARIARERMIDPARTDATFDVQRVRATKEPLYVSKTITVQDPDRSEE